MSEELKSFNVLEHVLVPKHELLSEKEKEEVLKKLGLKPEELPLLLVTDPAARAIGAKPGDVVRIIRESPTAGKAIAYRLVVEV
ncbi:MAG: DNA-directed RNA polymerase subunit H [Candidatus Hadarchaeales archaeon]